MPYRILIVEDEPIIGLDLADMLQDAGYETVGIAKDMYAALRFAKEQTIDLATMDVQLARGTNGVETARKLWEDHEILSLFVSASLDPETRSQAASVNPVGFVEKPIAAGKIVDLLKAHFAGCASL